MKTNEEKIPCLISMQKNEFLHLLEKVVNAFFNFP